MINSRIVNIGIFGGGNIATGVINLLKENNYYNNTILNIKTICVKHLEKQREFILPFKCNFTNDPNKILDDDSIHIVIELIGGINDAKNIIFKSLLRGKHVITANKVLIGKYYEDIYELLNKNPNLSINFEGAVCGGIPIINTINNSYVADKINSIIGIINGTTNYILTKIFSDKITFDQALLNAQQLGYSELQPDDDIYGYDARSKLVILSYLAYKIKIDENKIFCQGITNILYQDFINAKNLLNSNIKLLGVSKKNNNTVSLFVSPCLINFNNNLAFTDNVNNCVHINSNNLNDMYFIGPGAGRYPTANSVINDLINIVNYKFNKLNYLNNHDVNYDFKSIFYIRFYINKNINYLENNIIKEEYKYDNYYIILTHPSIYSNVKSFCDLFNKTNNISNNDFILMPIIT